MEESLLCDEPICGPELNRGPGTVLTIFGRSLLPFREVREVDLISKVMGSLKYLQEITNDQVRKSANL